MTKEPNILWEGACAYVVRKNDSSYDIMIHSSDHVTHILGGNVNTGDRAEQICRRLNAYPNNTRKSYGLL